MRVLVADDHSLFRDGLVSLLEAGGFEVAAQVGDGRAAVQAALALRPDIVLLDLAMPAVSGLEALREIRAAWPQARVVILSASDDEDSLFKASEAGASGYLLKSLKADQFLEMLHGLERGEAAMTRQTTARLLAGLNRAAAHPPAAPDALTAQESRLLQYIAEGLSNKAIAQAMSVSENTVKYHIKNILQKLGVHNRTEAAGYAIRSGLHKPERMA
ncbi:MAG: response regulator transcription factor [Anaerolineales bacterium]|nr:response regulator transcription factor [Anaerolineales bacterium]